MSVSQPFLPNMSKRGREVLDSHHPQKTPHIASKFASIRLTSPHTGVANSLVSLKDPSLKSPHCAPVAEAPPSKEALEQDDRQCNIAKLSSHFQVLLTEDALETKLLSQTIGEYADAMQKYRTIDTELEDVRRRNGEVAEGDEAEFRDQQERLTLANEQLAGLHRKLDAVRDAVKTLDSEDGVLTSKETEVRAHIADLQTEVHRLEARYGELQAQEGGMIADIRAKLAATEKIAGKIAESEEEVTFLRKEIAHYAALKKG